MGHLLISAAHKSSGKTTVSIGLCAALRARGLAVQPFKKGPDYIDPMWLGGAAGRCCHNLDFHTQDPAEIAAVFGARMRGADIGLIEGNKGLYDGLDLDGSNSNAALAKLLGSPVVLVVETRGMTRGIAPLLLGYQAFDPEIRIAGVILNKVGGTRHESKLRAIVEHYTDIPVLGAVQADPEMEIGERHLGLVPSNEATEARSRIDTIAALVGRQVDMDRLIELAGAASPPVAVAPRNAGGPPDLRIGLARDRAFGFYYPADLQSLEAAGATLVPIDMTADASLPDIDGLFLGGGFPETLGGPLSANRSLREGVRRAIDGGLPTYAECGGLMYLSNSVLWHGERFEMAGLIPADTVMDARPQGRGYVRLRETGAGPWPLRDADGQPAEFPAHEFHYSRLENLSGPVTYAYRVLRGHGIDGRNDGIVYRNLLASYAHMRDVAANPWTGRFVAFVRACKKGGGRVAAVARHA